MKRLRVQVESAFEHRFDETLQVQKHNSDAKPAQVETQFSAFGLAENHMMEPNPQVAQDQSDADEQQSQPPRARPHPRAEPPVGRARRKSRRQCRAETCSEAWTR